MNECEWVNMYLILHYDLLHEIEMCQNVTEEDTTPHSPWRWHKKYPSYSDIEFVVNRGTN